MPWWGIPRRAYRDGKNVRVEHWRTGLPLTEDTSMCELPDRYAFYLRDYALAQCLSRRGPGQDLKLAAHYTDRWNRGLTRLKNRVARMFAQRAGVMGAQADRLIERPARPKAPWPYGERVR